MKIQVLRNPKKQPRILNLVQLNLFLLGDLIQGQEGLSVIN